MIRSVHGTISAIEPGGVVLDVSGWGVFVHLTSTEPLPIGSEATFATHLTIHQGGPELYGFLDSADRAFFELLLMVPRLGPKTALSLLRRATREQLESAIVSRDTTYFTRVVGISKKAAEKIIIELAEKITLQEPLNATDDADVFDMLVALGYTEREARQALGAIPKKVSGREERLRAALAATIR